VLKYLLLYQLIFIN